MNKSDFNNTFQIFMCYVGAVIGAGFATGQEIVSFFIEYGVWGGVGVAVCGVLFFAYGYVALAKIRRRNISSFSGYFNDISGKGLGKIIEIIAYAFMFASFCVMVSGSGAVAEQMFGMQTAGVVAMSVLCFFIFLKGVNGMVVVNAVMTPLIAIGIILVSAIALLNDSTEVFRVFGEKSATDNFLVSSIVYVSYNTVTLIGVLLPLKKKITTQKVAFYSSLLSGLALAAMGGLLWLVLWILREDIGGVEVPMLYVASLSGVMHLYAAVLYMAMITTASSSGFALIEYVKSKTRLGTLPISAFLCIISIPLAYVGFANLVDKLYRFFGVVGAFVLFAVLLDGARGNRKIKKHLQ